MCGAQSGVHADESSLKRFASSTATQFIGVTEGRSTFIFSVKNPLGLPYREVRRSSETSGPIYHGAISQKI